MSAATRYYPVVLRSLLGLIYFVFGLNGFLQFIEMPPLEGAPAVLMGAFAQTGYFFPLLKSTEVLAGAMLLAGAFVPLAQILLAPITINILAYHLFVAKDNPAMAVVMVLFQVGLAWAYRDSFRSVLAMKAKPSA